LVCDLWKKLVVWNPSNICTFLCFKNWSGILKKFANNEDWKTWFSVIQIMYITYEIMSRVLYVAIYFSLVAVLTFDLVNFKDLKIIEVLWLWFHFCVWSASAEACNELMAYSLILSCCCYTCCIRRKLRKMLNITVMIPSFSLVINMTSCHLFMPCFCGFLYSLLRWRCI
jgi:hypothetical protein